MKPTLCLRISRRAVAAAVITGEHLTFHDGRHLTSKADRAIAGADRYVRRILDLTRPTLVAVDAPAKDGSLTERLLKLIEEIVRGAGVRFEALSTSDILASYGMPGLRNRIELRETVEPYWHDLANMKAKVRPFVLEAAAGALYVDTREELGVAAEP